MILNLDTVLDSSRTVVVGLSGGVDSVVLLHAAAQWASERDVRIKAVHVHHGLSHNADHWAGWCMELCESLEVDCAIERVNLGDMAGESVENIARKARYAVFKKHSPSGTQLLLGHHQDDQLETMLLALKRGSGLQMLRGMSLKSNIEGGVEIIRPMLQIDRKAIVEHARHHGYEWVEDESNQSNKYDRNFLRNTVIPLLKARWPGFLSSVNRASTILSSEKRLLDDLVGKELLNSVDGLGNLKIDSLTQSSADLRNALLREWIRGKGFVCPRSDKLDQIYTEVAMCRPDRKPRFRVPGGNLTRHKGVLLLEKDKEPGLSIYD